MVRTSTAWKGTEVVSHLAKVASVAWGLALVCRLLYKYDFIGSQPGSCVCLLFGAALHLTTELSSFSGDHTAPKM